jgi:Na+/H+ antiporter NhaD/arsenite permease-like protein
MNYIMNYLFIGVVFMFIVELISNTKAYEKVKPKDHHIGYKERTLGVIAWPVCLVVFLFYFFKSFFKIK